MNKSQNISSNGPANLKSFPSTSKPEIKQYSPREEKEPPAANTNSNTNRRKKTAMPLELYGGSGNVRSEQPSQRGGKIDIIV